VFLVFFLANLLLIPLGWVAIKAARRILDVPRNLLMPIILLFCIVGAFAINNTVFAVIVILVFGVAAYFMEENGYPVAPAILGVILGAMLEEHFITSMIKSDGRFLGFFERPIAAALGIVTILVWLWPVARRLAARRRAPGA
jgi:TctA family transporter